MKFVIFAVALITVYGKVNADHDAITTCFNAAFDDQIACIKECGGSSGISECFSDWSEVMPCFANEVCNAKPVSSYEGNSSKHRGWGRDDRNNECIPTCKNEGQNAMQTCLTVNKCASADSDIKLTIRSASSKIKKCGSGSDTGVRLKRCICILTKHLKSEDKATMICTKYFSRSKRSIDEFNEFDMMF